MAIDQAVRTERRQSFWAMPFVLGLLMAVLGVFAIASAPATGFLSIIVLGALLVVGGVIEVIHALTHREQGNRLLYLLGGILSAAVGVLLIARTGIGLAALTLMLAGYFVVNGLFHAIASIVDRYPRWGWDFVLGLVSILLGFIVFSQWPVSSLWLVGTLVGIELLFRGSALMGTAIALRQLFRKEAHVLP